MALKHSYFFRPASRPSSPAPPPATLPSEASSPLMSTMLDRTSPDRVPRSLNRLSFTPFRRASPAPPPLSTTPAPAPATLTQDGSYLDALSLKLSEAVSRALAQPVGPAGTHELLSGRKPLPAGRGAQLGALIAAELKAAAGNANLRRAIVRALQRPLSVLLTNVSSKLLPLLAAPAFHDPPAATPNPTQLHAVAYATFCGELVDALADAGLDADARADGLRAVREDLVAVVGRVVTPLLNGVKAALMPAIDALEQPAPASSARGARTGAAPAPHPAMATLQSTVPVCAKALARYCATPTAQALLAPLLISTVWRALVALAHRPAPAPAPAAPPSQPPTPRVQPVGLRKPRSASGTTPPTTPPATRFALKLPPSRPPTPPGSTPAAPGTPAADARALCDLLAALPRPGAEHAATRLAREAVDEAFDALRALAQLLDATAAAAAGAPVDIGAELARLGEDLPELLALQVLLPACVYEPGARAPGVPELLGVSEDEYRRGYLAGFGRAEEYAPVVGRRVLGVLQPLLGAPGALRPGVRAVLEWLEDVVEEGDSDSD